jgi:hypothetical protein
LIAIWIATLVTLIAIVTSQVASGPRPTASIQGVVISKEPTNHALVNAEFVVNEVRYVAVDSFIGPPNPEFDAVNVGDAVTVFYDPADPTRARLHEPEPLSTGLVFFGVTAMLLVPTLFVTFLYLAFRSRRLLAHWAGRSAK